MTRSRLLFANLALALAAAAAGAGAATAAQDETAPVTGDSQPDRGKAPLVSIPGASSNRTLDGGAAIQPVFLDAFRLPNAEQVRIEQRVTIRISPRPAPMPLSLAAAADSRDDGAPRTIERKMGKCVPLNSVLGVQSGGANKLMLFMRGQRLVSATLEKACQGRDYYSGFLVAQHSDGQLCADRDELLARSGAKCKVQGYREIMLADD